jgi:hypothetical protein
MNEFTSAPIDVVDSVTTSDIDCNTSVTVTFSTVPFGPSFPETIFVYGIHPNLGLDLHYDVDRHNCQLFQMAPDTPSHILSQCTSHLRSAYILYIDTMSVHAIDDVRLIISEAQSDSRKMNLQIVYLWSVSLSLQEIVKRAANSGGEIHSQSMAHQD